MKKLILILILVATLLVARYYFQPDPPRTSHVATVVDFIDDELNVVEEVPAEPFVPDNPLAEIEEGSDAPSIEDEASTQYMMEKSSSISWIGRKIGGQHNGTIDISTGSVYVSNGIIVGGEITFDMESMQALDTQSEKLHNDLRSKNWFDTLSYPTATFQITDAGPVEVAGLLTMKGVTKKIIFPATVIIEEDTVIVDTAFSLDRTAWGVTGGVPTVSEYMDLSMSLVFRPVGE